MLLLVSTLLNRILRICMEEKDRETEIKKLKHVLVRNEYPKEVVDEVISKELDKIEKRRRQQEQAEAWLIKKVRDLLFYLRKCDGF
jgi:hypothetical protein